MFEYGTQQQSLDDVFQMLWVKCCELMPDAMATAQEM